MNASELLLISRLNNTRLIDKRKLTLVLVVEIGILSDISDRELRQVLVVLLIEAVANSGPIGDLSDTIGLGELLIGQFLVLLGRIIRTPAVLVVVDCGQ